MSIIDKISTLLKEEKKTQKDLMDHLGLEKSTFTAWKNGKNNSYKKYVPEIAEYFGVSTDYILEKTDKRNPGDEENIFEKYKELRPITTKKFPLLGKVACGVPIFDEEFDSYIEAASDIKADFALVCKGDSMINARIHDGDVVFIRKAEMVDNGKIAAVSIEGEVTLKRVYYYPEKNKLILSPENPSYEPFVYVNEELDDIRILGVAIAFTSLVK